VRSIMKPAGWHGLRLCNTSTLYARNIGEPSHTAVSASRESLWALAAPIVPRRNNVLLRSIPPQPKKNLDHRARDVDASLGTSRGLLADHFGIRPKDAANIRNNPPSPDKFKALRKQLNEEEGHDYSARVLHHVYAEQRATITKQKRASTPPMEAPMCEKDLLLVQSALKQEIESFKKGR